MAFHQPVTGESSTPGSGRGADLARARRRLVGRSVPMRELLAQVEKVAVSDLTCLVTGETGSGKELVARAIHRSSPRRDCPFVVLDCSSIPHELIESTLFGHEKGAFTGALELYRGHFEQADGGTIFLDEIGELDRYLQPKLLRVLEHGEVKRVGGARTIHVDVRVVAATNRDLSAQVATGDFREDLFYRLSVVHLKVPPLRRRIEDIVLIAESLLGEISVRRGQELVLDRSARDALTDYSWPGNVRELRNVVERAAALCDGSTLTRADLRFQHEQPLSQRESAGLQLQGRPAAFAPELMAGGQSFKEAKPIVVDAFEAVYLKALVERNSGNISHSADEAGLTRYHLRELLKRHGLTR